MPEFEFDAVNGTGLVLGLVTEMVDAIGAAPEIRRHSIGVRFQRYPRYKAGAADTSLLGSTVSLSSEGEAHALIEDDDALGRLAFLVVLGPDGRLVAQINVTIGGEG